MEPKKAIRTFTHEKTTMKCLDAPKYVELSTEACSVMARLRSTDSDCLFWDGEKRVQPFGCC